MADEPTYADLNELLAAYVGMQGLVSSLLGLTADLSTLAREVKLASINAMLQARAPDVLDPANEKRFSLFLEALNGAASEVEVVTGADPQPAPRRKLALRAIALATAADIEEALFPEQQVGDGARAAYLRRRYDAVMTTLTGASDADGVTTSPLPAGSFPEPVSYPDPVRSGPWGSSWGPTCW